MANLRLASGSPLRMARAGLGVDRLVECDEAATPCGAVLPNVVTLAVSGVTLNTFTCRFCSIPPPGTGVMASFQSTPINGLYSLTKVNAVTWELLTGSYEYGQRFGVPQVCNQVSTGQWRWQLIRQTTIPPFYRLQCRAGVFGEIAAAFIGTACQTNQVLVFTSTLMGDPNSNCNVAFGGVASVSLP